MPRTCVGSCVERVERVEQPCRAAVSSSCVEDLARASRLPCPALPCPALPGPGLPLLRYRHGTPVLSNLSSRSLARLSPLLRSPSPPSRQCRSPPSGGGAAWLRAATTRPPVCPSDLRLVRPAAARRATAGRAAARPRPRLRPSRRRDRRDDAMRCDAMRYERTAAVMSSAVRSSRTSARFAI